VIGFSVVRQRLSYTVSNKCNPNVANIIIMNDRKNPTFTKGGIDKINDFIKTLIP